MSESNTSICCGKNCGKPARLACPTCIKLDIPPSRFCSQDCFKANWNEHKLIHNEVKLNRNLALLAAENPSDLPRNFTHYKFTGKLRPWKQSPRRPIPANIPTPDYYRHPTGHSQVEAEDRRTNNTIKVYTQEEIDGIREACRIGREVLDEAGSIIRVGVTTDEIDQRVHEATISRGAFPSPLNYYNFPKSVCTSVNEVICHGIPDLRPLEEGDIVNVDVSVYYNGYHADLNETFFVGAQSEDSKRLVKCAYESLAAAISICKPGTLYKDIGEKISKVALAANCSIVTTYCGHGIGKLFHTAPTIPHYARNKCKGTMEVGHVFTIEPMINLGGSKDVLWPDDWTAVTADGSRSAQFEHTILITNDGCELLTRRIGEELNSITWTDEKFQR